MATEAATPVEWKAMARYQSRILFLVMTTGIICLSLTVTTRAAAEKKAHGPTAPAIAATQPADADLPASVIQIMAQLNDPAYAVRQDMTRQLLADEKLTPGMVEWLIDQAGTYEQLNRLLKVAKQVVLRTAAEKDFKQSGPGALGVLHESVDSSSYPWLKDRHGILVMVADPGFPAYAWLEPGDVIIGVDGHAFDSHTTAATFKARIESHACGDTVAMRIRRGDQTLDVHFRLGSAAALNGMYTLKDHHLRLGKAYRARWLKTRKKLLSHASVQPVELREVKEHDK